MIFVLSGKPPNLKFQIDTLYGFFDAFSTYFSLFSFISRARNYFYILKIVLFIKKMCFVYYLKFAINSTQFSPKLISEKPISLCSICKKTPFRVSVWLTVYLSPFINKLINWLNFLFAITSAKKHPLECLPVCLAVYLSVCFRSFHLSCSDWSEKNVLFSNIQILLIYCY
jgi:hypothetical protein